MQKLNKNIADAWTVTQIKADRVPKKAMFVRSPPMAELWFHNVLI